MIPPYRKAGQGFTLIEVLIAMTLLGLMVVLLFSSMKICADSWQKGEDKITEVNEIAVVYQFFQHHLSTARPLWNNFSDENKLLAFQGKNQELRFVSGFPASAKKAGLQLFTLTLDNSDNEQALNVSISPFFPVAENEEWRKEEVTLLRHMRKFSLSYYGLDESQPDGLWQEDWLDRETQPRLVKIEIEREDGSFWPEMVIEIKSPGDSSDADVGSLEDDGSVVDDADFNDQQ